MFRSITTTAVAALVAGPVCADGVNYVRLSYSYLELDAESSNFDRDNGLFQGAVEYEVSQFLLSADVLDQRFETGYGGHFIDKVYNLSAAYMMTPEALAGLGLISNDLRYGDDPTTGFEVFGQYQTTEFAVGLNVSKQDTDTDNITTAVVGEYNVASSTTLGVSIVDQSELDEAEYRISVDYAQGPITARVFLTGDSYLDGGIFGVLGNYEFTPKIRAGAAYLESYGRGGRDSWYYSIGGGYQIVDGLWFDASYGVRDIELDIFDAEIVQAVLSYELGDQKRIDRRFRRAEIDDTRAWFRAFEF